MAVLKYQITIDTDSGKAVVNSSGSSGAAGGGSASGMPGGVGPGQGGGAAQDAAASGGGSGGNESGNAHKEARHTFQVLRRMGPYLPALAIMGIGAAANLNPAQQIGAVGGIVGSVVGAGSPTAGAAISAATQAPQIVLNIAESLRDYSGGLFDTMTRFDLVLEGLKYKLAGEIEESLSAIIESLASLAVETLPLIVDLFNALTPVVLLTIEVFGTLIKSVEVIVEAFMVGASWMQKKVVDAAAEETYQQAKDFHTPIIESLEAKLADQRTSGLDMMDLENKLAEQRSLLAAARDRRDVDLEDNPFAVEMADNIEKLEGLHGGLMEKWERIGDIMLGRDVEGADVKGALDDGITLSSALFTALGSWSRDPTGHGRQSPLLDPHYMRDRAPSIIPSRDKDGNIIPGRTPFGVTTNQFGFIPDDLAQGLEDGGVEDLDPAGRFFKGGKGDRKFPRASPAAVMFKVTDSIQIQAEDEDRIHSELVMLKTQIMDHIGNLHDTNHLRRMMGRLRII